MANSGVESKFSIIPEGYFPIWIKKKKKTLSISGKLMKFSQMLSFIGYEYWKVVPAEWNEPIKDTCKGSNFSAF